MKIVKRAALHVLLVGIFLGSLAAFYSPALDLYFERDDFSILERSKIRAPADLIAAFSPDRALHHSYRPISTGLYFGLMQSAVGVDAFPFHVASLIILAANSLLVFGVLRLLGIRPAVSIALAVIYPVCTVNFHSQLWISVIQDLSATFFVLLAFAAYALSRRSRGVWILSAAAVLYIAAVLSKETAVTLVAIVFVFEWMVCRTPPLASVRAVAPFIAVAAIYLPFRVLAISTPGDGQYAMELGRVALASLGRYAETTADALVFTSNPWVLGLLVGVCALVSFGADSRRLRIVSFGLLWYLATLAPVLPLTERWSEFYLMMPIVGALIAIAGLLDAVAERVSRPSLLAIAAVVMTVSFWGASRAKFSATVEEHEWLGSSESIVEAVRSDHPTLPADTLLFFSFPAEFPSSKFLWRQGAVFRVVYDEPTLKAFAVTEKQLRVLRRNRDEGSLIYTLDSHGRLLADPSNHIAQPL